MCDPISLALLAAGTAASVGGGIMAGREGVKNASNIASARNKELDRVLALNDQDTQQAREKFNTLVSGINDNSGADLNTAQAERAGDITSAVSSAPDLPIEIGENAPKVVKSDLAGQLSEGRNKSLTSAESLGKLGGYSDFFQNQAISNDAGARGIDTNLDAIRGRMRLLPSFLDYEQAKVKPVTGIGDVIRSIGQTAAMAAPTVSGWYGSSGAAAPKLGGYSYYGGPR